ncbi:hypothetical protein PCC7424_0646 [Gloeothece citriformis PCC 7424]|uniref:Uncharacterized protein n=1 Tax=Gloeothece citriformis (strain PCC 7424) TaxID=65393 RepID=B7KET1_GLOC7|nr:hypothetical protein [Gloeothece citriformis]ACK69106.1 hypothetical protein PCC7424_0646 [Gloeothece citriformis PCC 7424]
MKTVSIFFSGLLSIGVLGHSLPAVGNEIAAVNNDFKPIVAPTGTVEDLTGVQSRNIAKDLGGIGGGSEDLQLLPQSDFKPEMSAYEAKTRAMNLRLDVSDQNMGDTSRITRRLPFLHF